MFETLRKPAFAKLYVIPLISNIAYSMTGSISVLYALDLGADVLLVNLIATV
jgi:MFS family permease